MERQVRMKTVEFGKIFDKLPLGYAYPTLLFDEKNQPSDYVNMDGNEAYEKMMGLKKKML